MLESVTYQQRWSVTKMPLIMVGKWMLPMRDFWQGKCSCCRSFERAGVRRAAPSCSPCPSAWPGLLIATGWSFPPSPGNRRSAGVRVPCWSWQCSEHQNISAQGAPSSLDAFLSYCNAVCTLSFPSPEISLPHYLHFLWGWAHLIKEISCDLLC